MDQASDKVASVEQNYSKDRNKRRRSSFRNRSKSGDVDGAAESLFVSDEIMLDPKESEWKHLYTEKLIEESKCWKNLCFETKCKYRKILKKGNQQRFINEMLMNQEERDFLKSNGIYTKLDHNLKILNNVITINNLLKNKLQTKTSRLANFQENELNIVIQEGYTSALKMSYDDDNN